MQLAIKKFFLLPFLATLSLFISAYLIFNGYSTLTHTFEGSRTIVAQQNTIQHAISDMYRAAHDRIYVLVKMSATVDDFELDELRQKMRLHAGVFLTARNKIFALKLSPAELEHYYPTSLRQNISKNASTQNKAADLFVEKKHEQAINTMLKYDTPEQMDLLASIAMMNTMLDKETEKTMSSLNTDFTDARLDFKILGTFVFLIFTTLIITIITRLLYGKHILSGRLENQEIQYKRIVDTVQDGIITMSENGYISSFNRGAERMFGYQSNHIIGKNFSQLISHRNHDALNKYIASVINNSDLSGLSITGKRNNNEALTLHISFSATGLTGEQKLSGIIRDVTAQKKTEEEQIKESKLESIGVLAGGIAHDFNNILFGISGYIDLALKSLADKDKTTRFLTASLKATQRATNLTQQLLTFSKGGEPIKQNSNIVDVLHESTNFNLHGSNISCHYDIADDLWVVNIDSDQISQVIHNIVINAKIAMEDSGEIHISCHNSLDIVNQGIVKSSGQYIKITITDTGIGIPEDILDSIFDPYFTTREAGSGLGLALSYSIINKHNGFIYVKSTPGKGSCFTVYLPASPNQDIDQNKKQIKTANCDTRKHIMLMDDDKVIRDVTQTMLEHMGYEVTSVATGEEAIKAYKSTLYSDASIDLIIMDLTILGGMGGKETIQIIHSLNPEAKAIVSSGYSNDTVMANFSVYGFHDSMAKPYTYDVLSNTIKENL